MIRFVFEAEIIKKLQNNFSIFFCENIRKHLLPDVLMLKPELLKVLKISLLHYLSELK